MELRMNEKTSSDTWRDRFLCFALFYSTFSKDTSTKVGCVITDSLNRPIGFGTNGFARTYQHDEATFEDRVEKYKRVLHAEENAIYNATKEVRGGTAYISHPPCLHCSHILAQNGISKVVSIKPTGEFADRWCIKETTFELDALGVEFEVVERPSSDSIVKALDQWQKTVIG
jgi:dCMP deaminase